MCIPIAHVSGLTGPIDQLADRDVCMSLSFEKESLNGKKLKHVEATGSSPVRSTQNPFLKKKSVLIPKRIKYVQEY